MGMYTVCTFQLAKAMELDFLLLIPKYFIFIALIAWFTAIFGLAHHLVTTLRKVPDTSSKAFSQAPASK
jgi:hypothetical protein